MKKNLFNPSYEGTKTTTGIVHGDTDGMLNLNELKYPWAYNLWEMMLANTWFPKEVDLTNDVKEYKNLLPSEKRAYDKVLSQLIFMDSIQTNNTPDNVNSWITAPEVNMCLVRQAFEEALHSQSYAVMVDSISINTDEIYKMYKKDANLLKKNEYILSTYVKYAREIDENDSDEAKVYMIMANQCLEGIYFYSGFTVMYALARIGKMLGSAQMIRFIQRDEVTHLLLFANIFRSMRKQIPSIFTEEVIANCTQMLKDAAELEIEWGRYITEEGILGLTPELLERFVKYLANERAKAVEIPLPFPEDALKNKNPIEWFDDFSSLNDQKTNFFEGNVANYAKNSIDLNDF